MAQPTTTEDSRQEAKEQLATAATHGDEDDAKDNDTFEFRLFAPAAAKPSTASTHNHNHNSETTQQQPPTPNNPNGSPQTQRIRLSTPDPASTPASNQPTRRPQEYYIAAPATAAQRAQYAEAAITGEQVKQLASRPCPGLRMPWRVIRLPASAFAPGLLPAAAREEDDDDAGGGERRRRRRRARKGKKTRLLIRRKVQAGREREAARRAEAVAAEELARIKAEKVKEKTRRVNRKKQLKKRERLRERKKAETGVASVDSDGLAGGTGQPSD